MYICMLWGWILWGGWEEGGGGGVKLSTPELAVLPPDP